MTKRYGYLIAIFLFPYLLSAQETAQKNTERTAQQSAKQVAPKYSQEVNSSSKISLQVKGLKAPVEVLRDQWGVNHIYASNQYDLFFTQGYCAVKDRTFQFEIWRRQATGTVSEILGSDELKRDIGTRLFKFRGDLKKELNHYHKNGEEIINAYVDGINAYIDEVNANPELLPFEFGMLNIKPGKWTPDVVISRHQGLLGNITQELTLGRAVAKVGADKVKDLLWFHPKQPNLSLDTSITLEMLSKNILELYTASHRTVTFRKEDFKQGASSFSAKNSEQDLVSQEYDGSNNWIISGKRTANGSPILANDPHRSIALPSLRYMVHLVAPGWNVIGGGEPVIPGVSIGHNEYGAWGLTIFETDGEDLYVYDLNPSNLNQYKYKGEWKDMSEIKETISIKDSSDVEVSLKYTIHGPVTFIDSSNKKGYAVRCAWMEPGGAPYLASLRVNQAKNWNDFREAMSYSHIPGENMIWADRKNNIGWQVVGINPIRKNFSGMVPVPGDGRFEWSGYQDIKQRPHELNPKKGFLATANQHVTPSNYKYPNTIAYTWADPYRGNRINEVLESDKSVTIEETVALQTDITSLPARTLVPMLKEIEPVSDLAKKAKATLQNWNFELDKNSVGAGIYATWERKLYTEANARFIPKELTGLASIQLSKLISWLQEPGDRFVRNRFLEENTVSNAIISGTEKIERTKPGMDSNAEPLPGNHSVKYIQGRNEFLSTTFENAIKELSSKFGTDINSWQYGQPKYKHTQLFHPLNAGLSEQLKDSLNLGPLPRGGNSHTPNATGGTDRQMHGASFRIITDLSDWNKTLMINTPGQSADPRSKYYKNLFELWANDGYFPAYYTRDKIETVTDQKMELKPKE